MSAWEIQSWRASILFHHIVDYVCVIAVEQYTLWTTAAA